MNTSPSVTARSKMEAGSDTGCRDPSTANEWLCSQYLSSGSDQGKALHDEIWQGFYGEELVLEEESQMEWALWPHI
ncbi:hypothetical protein [Brevibacillus reuszeri]|uniref:hypothetical protein n=1 Tax=Brevibacillus reuszeri TaxID=54915 RepID=UPI003D22C09E